MKLALIPPFSGMHFLTSAYSYHMMLPQLVHNPLYAEKYRHLSQGHFVMMDNGAAESKMLNNKDLMEVASEYKPSELILPDIKGDALGTLSLIKEFLSLRPRHNLYPDMSLVAVAQGRTGIELQRMIEVIADMRRVTTIGIPRHLLATIGNNAARLTLAKWITKRYNHRFEIHFLGAAPAWPYEIFFARELGIVRSMDTSMPFNYALNNLALRDDRLNIARPDNYFEAEFTVQQDELARRNCTIMHQWATGVQSYDRITES